MRTVGSKLASALLMLSLASTSALAAELTGKSSTNGGKKSFCKGSTQITASLTENTIAIRTPLATGGIATVRGKLDSKGGFKASGNRFTFTGKVKGKSVSGSWKGPSCFGKFNLS